MLKGANPDHVVRNKFIISERDVSDLICRNSLGSDRGGNGAGPTMQGLEMVDTPMAYRETTSTRTARLAMEP